MFVSFLISFIVGLDFNSHIKQLVPERPFPPDKEMQGNESRRTEVNEVDDEHEGKKTLSGLLSEVHGGDGRAKDQFAYFMVAYPLYVRRIVTDMGGIRLGGVGGGEHHDIFYSFIFHSQEAAGKMWQGDVRATARHKTGELLAEETPA